MDYNNSLLEHLQRLEESQLVSTREIQEKQKALRQATSACDSATAEAAELKRKLTVAQVL
jgi:hypothetical protein